MAAHRGSAACSGPMTARWRRPGSAVPGVSTPGSILRVFRSLSWFWSVSPQLWLEVFASGVMVAPFGGVCGVVMNVGVMKTTSAQPIRHLLGRELGHHGQER